ncbi:helix-turn-helix domain-containing protein [Acidisoma sp. C75]
MDARAIVARNIRRLRVMRQLSQEALAVDAGIDRTYVSRLERGIENPTVAVLEKIAGALGAEIIEFFVVPEAGDPPPGSLPSGRKSAAARRAKGERSHR